MSKKIIAIMMSTLLVLSFAACGAKEEDGDMNVTPVETPAETPAETPEEPKADIPALVTKYFAEMPEHIYKIDNKEFVALVGANEDMTVIDIRSAEDYAKGHVKGAVNMPWGPAVAEGLKSIPTDKPVYIYCYTGQTAGQAVATLNIAGIPARSVHLGWNLGISKVEGYESVVTTEAATLAGDVTKIDEDIQKAMDDYYAGLAGVADSKYKNYKISEADLKAMVDAKDAGMYILSVRSAEDYAAGHIEGAENIPFAKGMAASFGTLPKDKTIIVYCYTGQTAGQVVAGLRLMGYDAVSLNGGMGTQANAPQGWANAGYPVVK